jgi:hypothetical protein
MFRMNSRPSGEQGHTLIIFLVAAFVTGLLFVAYLSRPSGVDSELQPMNASGTQPTTRLEEYRADVDAAHKADALLQEKNRELENVE